LKTKAIATGLDDTRCSNSVAREGGFYEFLAGYTGKFCSSAAETRRRRQPPVTWVTTMGHQLALDFESNQAEISRKHDNEQHNCPMRRRDKQIACNSRLTKTNGSVSLIFLKFHEQLVVPATPSPAEQQWISPACPQYGAGDRS